MAEYGEEMDDDQLAVADQSWWQGDRRRRMPSFPEAGLAVCLICGHPVDQHDQAGGCGVCQRQSGEAGRPAACAVQEGPVEFGA